MSDYLNYLERGELIAERARVKTELDRLKIKKEDEISSKENLEAIKTDLNTIINKCDERLKAQMDEKRLEQSGGAREQTLIPLSGDVMVESMQKTAKMQQIMDTVRAIEKLKTGDSVETFVCSLSQLYNIEVKPQLGALPNLETEFVNCAKGLLTYPMFNQLEKSGKTIKNWSNLKEYLIATHGTRISNYQFLHRLWNCQLQEGERFCDFGARLEEKVHHASMHIQASFKKKHEGSDMTATDVFALMGAMLAALQIKSSNEDAYKSLIKTIDKNWSASTVLSDAADYADKMQSGEFAAPTVYHAKLVKAEKKQKPKAEKKKSTSKKSSDRLEEYKKKCANEICEAFLKGNCKYGDRCFRIHPKQNAHYTEIAEPEVEPEVVTESSSIQNLFH